MKITGRVPNSAVERDLAVSLLLRCSVLWGSLLGAESDFDDCVCALAARLGWSAEAGDDLSTALSAAGAAIEECGVPWSRLRAAAVEVFDEVRGRESVELDEYDGRTWEEAIGVPSPRSSAEAGAQRAGAGCQGARASTGRSQGGLRTGW